MKKQKKGFLSIMAMGVLGTIAIQNASKAIKGIYSIYKSLGNSE